MSADRKPPAEGSIATRLDVDHAAEGEPPPQAFANPPRPLKAVIVFLVMAVVAMIVAVALLK